MGALALALCTRAAADCGLDVYPPFSRYGYDSDACRTAWRTADWMKVTLACSSDGQNAGAERGDFAELLVAAQSWAKAAIAYSRLGQSDRADQARGYALRDARDARSGFAAEQPADSAGTEAAATLEQLIAAPNFFTPEGCAP